LAWIVEKFREWTDADRRRPEDAVSRDRLVANDTGGHFAAMEKPTLLVDDIRKFFSMLTSDGNRRLGGPRLTKSAMALR
jgi:hypothetical protein